MPQTSFRRRRETCVTATLNEKAIGGMGAIPHAGGVTFRVWAPHATAVFVTGTFNEWAADAHPMSLEENGYWFGPGTWKTHWLAVR